MRSYRKGEPHVHATRVTFYWRVNEEPDTGEVDDLIELPPNFGTAHTENRATEENILAAGQLRVKSSPDLQQRSNSPAHLDPSLSRLGDPRKHLEKRAL